MTLRSYIESFAKSREMSILALATQLGYKSTTPLYRLMDRNVRATSLQQFANRMIETFDLSTEEVNLLSETLKLKLRGKDVASVYEAVSSMLKSFQTGDGEEVHSSPAPSLEALRRYEHCTDLHITLFNSLDKDIIDEVTLLIEQAGAEVDHYINVLHRTEELLHSMRLLSRAFYHPNYRCYFLDALLHGGDSAVEDAVTLRGLNRGDIALCTYTDEGGVQRRDLLAFYPNALHIYPVLHDVLPVAEELYTSVKYGCPTAETAESYIAFYQQCAELEKNNAVYMLKPDFGFSLLSGELLLPLLMEGNADQFSVSEEMYAYILQMVNARYENNFVKRKPTFCVMSRRAVEAFIRTGLMSDHFWLLRPFKPEERLAALQSIRRNLMRSKYVHIYFLRNDEDMDASEVDLYENKGVLIQSASTEYRLSGTHAEILITHPTVMQCYRDYYFESLIKNQCLSEAESLAVLDELVAQCKEIVGEHLKSE